MDDLRSILPTSCPAAAPVLSIVVPSFNCGRYLGRALDSVLRQEASQSDYELVVVDNMSTDDTAGVLARYCVPNITIVREQDKGQSDALNKGFKLSRGEWFCWLNADDEFVPGALPYVIDALGSSTVANWMGGGMVWIDTLSSVLRCSPHLVVNAALRKLGVAHVGGPSSFFRRKLFEQAGPFSTEYHYCMDTDMWHRFQRHGERCHPMHQYVWAFRVHEESKTSHVVMTSVRSPKMTAELNSLKKNFMSPLAGRCQALVPWLWRLQGVVTGRDWKAYRDTRRFRGRTLASLATEGSRANSGAKDVG